ncbi:TraY domain-containing protein [Shewanella sp. M16]|uniref:TraY domain-containing protein n=1 Tax=Shewanella sp. M16 TaxID=2830837 RepID=UPI001BAEFCED|nr:TraY domain-containing protein [Shewanella sp. M16]MBS0045207.1 TraY domain-containing protein [Shewanella sp. M16]
MEEKKTTSINFEMDSETNQRLENASAHTKRTKRGEAAARLKDHLERFDVFEPKYVKKKV